MAHTIGATTYTVDVPLSAGTHGLRWEYYEGQGNGLAQLSRQSVANAFAFAPRMDVTPSTLITWYLMWGLCPETLLVHTTRKLGFGFIDAGRRHDGCQNVSPTPVDSRVPGVTGANYSDRATD